MKKNFYLYACFGLLAMLALYACTKEIDGRDSQGEAGRTGELTVVEAEAWFEDYAADFTLAGFKKATTRGDTDPVITPLWEQSRTFTIGETPMVEVPLLNVLPGYSYRARDSVSVAAVTEKAPNTMTYLLAQKDADGDVTYRVASIVADSAYLAGDPEKTVENLSVSNLSDFSGSVFYYDVLGELLDGVVYRDGTEVATIGPVGSASPGSSAAASRANGGCDIYHLWTTIPWTVTWYYYGEAIVASGHNTTVTTFYVCGLGGMGGGPGPGGMDPSLNPGTGGPGGTTNPPAVTYTTVNGTLPKMGKQEGETCATTCMAFINKFFGGDKTVGDFNKEYNEKYNADISEEGMVGMDTLKEFMESHFQTTVFTSYQDAINNNYLVIVGVKAAERIVTTPDGRQVRVTYSHALVVTGYGSDGSLTTVDPLTGEGRNVNPSDVLPQSTHVITGNK